MWRLPQQEGQIRLRPRTARQRHAADRACEYLATAIALERPLDFSPHPQQKTCRSFSPEESHVCGWIERIGNDRRKKDPCVLAFSCDSVATATRAERVCRCARDEQIPKRVLRLLSMQKSVLSTPCQSDSHRVARCFCKNRPTRFATVSGASSVAKCVESRTWISASGTVRLYA